MTGSETDKNLLLQRNEQLGEDFGTGCQHIAGLLPGLLTVEVGNKPAGFQNQQAASRHIPGLQMHAAVTIKTAGGHIRQLQYGCAKAAKTGTIVNQPVKTLG